MTRETVRVNVRNFAMAFAVCTLASDAGFHYKMGRTIDAVCTFAIAVLLVIVHITGEGQ